MNKTLVFVIFQLIQWIPARVYLYEDGGGNDRKRIDIE